MIQMRHMLSAAGLLALLLGVEVCTASVCNAQQTQSLKLPIPAPRASTPAPAQAGIPAIAAKFPETPVGQRATMFLEALNSGDIAKLNAYVEQWYPKMRGNPQLAMIQDGTGGLDLIAVDRFDETSMLADLKSRKTGKPVRMLVSIEKEEPHLVISIGLMFG